MTPIIVKKGWLMYQVEKEIETTYCLYKQEKCGCAISVALYVVADEEDAIDIFKKHIPLIPKKKDYIGDGIVIRKNFK